MRLIEKLRQEIGRYQNRAFVKAAMAACAMIAVSDGRLSSLERGRVDAIVRALSRYPEMDLSKARQFFLEYVGELERDWAIAAAILEHKLRRTCDTWKKARTVLRVAWHVLQAPDATRPASDREFIRLCGVLGVQPQVARLPLETEVGAWS